MDVPSKVEQLIYRAIDELNASLPPAQAVAKSPHTLLFGPGGSLDSLGLVSLIVAAERQLETAFRTPIRLADERAMSQRNSPFRSIGVLRDYICGLLLEPTHA